MKKITVGKNSANQRADKFVQKTFPKLPASLMYKAFRKKDIKLDGKPIRPETVLPEGGVISLYLPDDALTPKAFKPVPGELDIIYEDKNIAVIDKPSGIPCQTGEGFSVSLSEIFKTYLYNRKEYDPKAESSFSPALCNRLDLNTRGIVIGAKSAEALRAVNEAIRNREAVKIYRCVVEGCPPKEEDTVFLRMGKDERENKAILSQSGALTETSYRVIERRGDKTLCEVRIKTGKSHQIRFTMAQLGCPITGDVKYGAREKGQLALAAHSFAFDTKNPLLTYLNGKTFYSKYSP